MNSLILLSAFVAAGFFLMHHCPLDLLVEYTVAIYLAVSGILVMVLQKRACESVRPLLLLALGLLVLPPLFRALASDGEHTVFGNRNMSGYVLIVLLALAVLVGLRFLVGRRRKHRRPGAKPASRQRERILPTAPLEGEGEEESSLDGESDVS